MIKRFFKSTSAATAIEYALLASLLAIACITAIVSFSDELQGLYSATASRVEGASQ